MENSPKRDERSCGLGASACVLFTMSQKCFSSLTGESLKMCDGLGGPWSSTRVL
jgi:hypothetical protein